MAKKEISLKVTLSEINKKRTELKKERIQLVYKYLDDNLGTDINKVINNEILQLKSIRTLRKEYKLHHNDISDSINSYIINVFGTEYKDLIYGTFWPGLSKYTKTKKPEFLKLVETQWEQFYPNYLEEFDSIIELSKKLNIKNRRTVSNWIEEFFINKFDEMGFSDSEAIELFKTYAKIKISTSKQKIGLNKLEIDKETITWNRIENKIAEKGWTIDYSKMNEMKFNSIKNIKKNIKIHLICNAKEAHYFTQSVNQILYTDSGCSHCFNVYEERVRKIGKNTDPLLSLSTLRFFISNKVTAKSEQPTNPSISKLKGTKHRVEVYLPNKVEFEGLIKNKLLRGEKIPDYITEIAIDFTLHIHAYISDKLFKYYQNANRFLIIVIYGMILEKDLIDINNYIRENPKYRYSEHVKVVSLKQFAEFFGMDIYKQGIYYKELYSIEKIAESAITSDSDFNNLAWKYEKIKNFLKKIRKSGNYELVLDDLDRFIGNKL